LYTPLRVDLQAECDQQREEQAWHSTKMPEAGALLSLPVAPSGIFDTCIEDILPKCLINVYIITITAKVIGQFSIHQALDSGTPKRQKAPGFPRVI
jgi:hypothetical protein